MTKVFLVEDEFVVREGIKNNVDWDGNGFFFCGEASDGELAWPLIKKEKPDIVITDIRMPFMDGLELSRLIKKDLPETKIVILSGHEEFEYAKSAINIGVEEYLLKPISSEELLTAIHRIEDKLNQEREEKKNIKKYELEMQENTENAKRRLFRDLISSETTLSEIYERGQELGIELTAGCYNIILLKMQRKQQEESFSQTIVEMEEKIEHYMEVHAEEVISFDRSVEGKAFLFKKENDSTIINAQERFIDYFNNIFKEYEGISYFGSIGTPVKRLRELSDCYEKAGLAFAYRFLSDDNMFLSAEKVDTTHGSLSFNSVQIGNVDTSRLDKRKVDHFLRSGEQEEICYFVQEYIKSMGAAGENSLLFRQYLVMDMYFSSKQVVESLSEEDMEELFHSPKQMQDVVSSLEATVDYVAAMFERVMQLRDQQNMQQYNDMVEQAKQYIEEHYGEEELSLNRIASHVNISPNHLSAVFSQKTGQTFVKYLTDMRMNKAKQLLKCTSKRSNEISMEIGYKDPHYFSYLFKKTQGCTPMQYREGKGGIE